MFLVFRRSSAVLFALICLVSVEGPGNAQDIPAQEHARRANEFLKAHQPEKAIPELAAVVAVDPGNVDAQANLGVLLYFQGRFVDALDPLRKALQLNGNLPKIQGLLGLAEYQLGQLDFARTDMSAAVGNLTDAKFRKEVGLALVEVETAQQDLIGAAATVSKLRESAPTDPEILYAGYRVHTDLAGESLLSLSLSAPESAQMQQAIAHELERVRDQTGAVAGFKRAIAINPNLPGIHFELAEALHGSASQSDRAQAAAEYEIALEKNPREVQAAVRLGDLSADKGNLDKATEFYDSVLKQRPKNADALLGMARVYSEKNENEEALPLLQQVLADDPTNLLAHFRLSALYRKLHKPDDAKTELAAYEKYKGIKDGLRQVYTAMKIEAPNHATEDATHEPAGGVKVPR